MEKENEEKWKRFLLFHIKTNMYRDKQNNLNFQHRIEERRKKMAKPTEYKKNSQSK